MYSGGRQTARSMAGAKEKRSAATSRVRPLSLVGFTKRRYSHLKSREVRWRLGSRWHRVDLVADAIQGVAFSEPAAQDLGENKTDVDAMGGRRRGECHRGRWLVACTAREGQRVETDKLKET